MWRNWCTYLFRAAAGEARHDPSGSNLQASVRGIHCTLISQHAHLDFLKHVCDSPWMYPSVDQLRSAAPELVRIESSCARSWTPEGAQYTRYLMKANAKCESHFFVATVLSEKMCEGHYCRHHSRSVASCRQTEQQEISAQQAKRMQYRVPSVHYYKILTA